MDPRVQLPQTLPVFLHSLSPSSTLSTKNTQKSLLLSLLSNHIASAVTQLTWEETVRSMHNSYNNAHVDSPFVLWPHEGRDRCDSLGIGLDFPPSDNACGTCQLLGCSHPGPHWKFGQHKKTNIGSGFCRDNRRALLLVLHRSIRSLWVILGCGHPRTKPWHSETVTELTHTDRGDGAMVACEARFCHWCHLDRWCCELRTNNGAVK